MRTNDFLRAVLPTEGVYFAASWTKDERYPKGGYFHNVPCSTIEEVALQAKALASAGQDAYFAMASFLEDSYWDPVRKKFRSRTQDNAQWVKSAWLDLDCGEQKAAKGRGYRTQAEAVKALKVFLKDTALPSPTLLVNSGNGIHAYWVFTQPVKAQLWTKVARMFKAVLAEMKVYADPMRTADAASVLRPPGTSNLKDPDNPKEVRVLREGAQVGFKTWATRLRDLSTQLRVSVPGSKPAARSKNSALSGGNPQHKPSDAEKLATLCPTVGAMQDSEGADQQEPLWYACLGVLAFTEQSDEICHAWSKGHEGYSYEACQEKIEARRATGFGPTTCDYIRQLEGSLCANCVQKCTSPIVLGHPDATHAVRETVEVSGGAAIDVGIPAMPEGMEDYVFDPERGGLYVWTEDKEGRRYQQRLCSAFPTIAYLYVDTDGEHYAHLRTRTRPGVWEESDIKASALAQGGYALASALGGKAGLVARNQKGVTEFMQTWFDRHRQNQDLQVMRRQMGWHADGTFVLGYRSYTADGEVLGCTLSKELHEYSSAHEPGGSRDEQVRLLDLLYNRPFYECYQFVLAASLGSALIPLIHDEPVGVPISLWEKDGGRGKTTACRLAIGLWGDHRGNAQVAHAENITEYAMYIMAGMRRHLPVLLDETTRWDPKHIAKFAYVYSSGVSRIQGKAEGGLRDNSTRNWQNFLLLTGNSSLVTKMDSSIPGCGPQVARVFEVEIKLRKEDLRKEDRELVRELSNHYGHIGTEFIKYVVPRAQKVKQFTNAIYKHLQDTVDDSADARYWLMTAACAIAANRIASSLGLFRWQREPLEQWISDHVRALRGVSNDMVEDPGELLSKMFNDLRTGFLVTDVFGGYSQRAMIDPHFPPPRNQEFTGRFITKHRELYIPIRVLKRWCSDQNIPYKHLQTMLQQGGWLADKSTKKSLTVGTKLGNIGQTRCWKLVFQPDDDLELVPDDHSH